jgi:hypothetical protein
MRPVGRSGPAQSRSTENGISDPDNATAHPGAQTDLAACRYFVDRRFANDTNIFWHDQSSFRGSEFFTGPGQLSTCGSFSYSPRPR